MIIINKKAVQWYKALCNIQENLWIGGAGADSTIKLFYTKKTFKIIGMNNFFYCIGVSIEKSFFSNVVMPICIAPTILNVFPVLNLF
jgi:hypothetical protein